MHDNFAAIDFFCVAQLIICGGKHLLSQMQNFDIVQPCSGRRPSVIKQETCFKAKCPLCTEQKQIKHPCKYI